MYHSSPITVGTLPITATLHTSCPSRPLPPTKAKPQTGKWDEQGRVQPSPERIPWGAAVQTGRRGTLVGSGFQTLKKPHPLFGSDPTGSLGNLGGPAQSLLGKEFAFLDSHGWDNLRPSCWGRHWQNGEDCQATEVWVLSGGSGSTWYLPRVLPAVIHPV